MTHVLPPCRTPHLRSSLRPGRRTPLLTLLVAGLLATTGCTDGMPGSNAEGGDRVQLDSLEVETLYQVGELDGEDWETFGQVSAVEFMDDGSLLIVDRQQSHVVVLDPDGQFVRTFGRQGQGPGEFQSVQRATVLGSGEIALPDMAQGRVHVFGADGEYLRSVVTPHGDGVPGGRMGAHGEAGLVGPKTVLFEAASGPRPDPPRTRPFGHWDLGEAEVEPRSRVIHEAWIPQVESEGARIAGADGNVRAAVGSSTFQPSLLHAVLPDGRLAVADSTTYTIRIVDAHDGVVDVVEKPHAPWPVTEAVERAYRESMEEAATGQIMGPDGPIDASEVIQARLESMTFWPERSILADLDADRAGRLWVRRSAEDPMEVGPVDLLLPDGSHLGTLPAETTLPHAFGPGDLAAWIEEDEFRVQYVRVGRIANLP
ncbi:MAG: 6-bladed beta-propeller [Gemmatimonadales bacterium]|nr:MAG: 6-bladed beta-propeller [Gemmatimonadales bacterium]